MKAARTLSEMVTLRSARHTLTRSALLRRAAAAAGLLLVALAEASAAKAVSDQLTSEERRQYARECVFVIELLQGYHLSDRPFGDIKSAELLEAYATRLDTSRMTFSAADLAYIKRRFERNLKTVYLFKGDLHPAFEIFDIFARRAEARIAWVEKRLGEPFDLTDDRTFDTAREKAAWPLDEAAADQLWEQRLKAEFISLRLATLSDADAASELRDRYGEYRKRFGEIDALIVRERFLDAMLASFDPHSGYFRHEAAMDFEKELSTVSSGVGLTMSIRDERAFVLSIDRGSPADRHGGINPGDEILTIANGSGAAAEKVAGRSHRELRALLAVKPSTTLALTVVPRRGGPQKDITLQAEEFAAIEHRARATLFRVPSTEGEIPVGLIMVPAFYGRTSKTEKTAKETTTSVSADVRELLAGLTAEGARAVVIDLRGNGGGLLEEAVKTAGLFVRSAPVLAVRGMDGKISVFSDEDGAVAYSGPLVVLTSPVSASASEAFAGALQHYRRALVVGSPATYGKGTAQGYLDLRQMQRADGSAAANWGMLRITQQYYYLPDGRSPQLTGVLSDVVLPESYDMSEYREAALPHAMPSKSITAPAAPENPTEGTATLSPALIASLRSASASRQNTLPEFHMEKRLADLVRTASGKKVMLNLEERMRKQERRKLEMGSLRRERRQLRTGHSYRGSYVETAAVAASERRHQEAVRLRCPVKEGGTYFDGHTVFQHVPAAGRILERPAAEFDFASHVSDAGLLAQAWQRATSTEMSEARMTQLLYALQRANDKADPTTLLEAVFARHSNCGPESQELKDGIAAFFGIILELDPLPHPGLPNFDVHRRESLRVAADLAAMLAAGSR